MSVKDQPHYTLPAATLAGWIERQSDRWWSVDGDPNLTSLVDFPYPGDELAPVIRKIGKDLLVYDRHTASTAHGEVIGSDRAGRTGGRQQLVAPQDLSALLGGFRH